MRLADDESALIPTAEEIAQFNEVGYYVSRTLFAKESIAEALEASERFYRVELDEYSVLVPDKFRPKGEYPTGLRKHDYSSMFSISLRKLVTHRILGRIAAMLVNTPEIRLWHDQLLYKPTDSPDKPSNVGWHTDRGYWKTWTSASMITAWIPFHDCPANMGTITMVNGSHHWPDNTEGLNFFSSDLEGLEKNFRTGGKPVVKTPIDLKAGQVSFHHCLTFHGSGPNRTPNPRRSIAVHLQDQSNRFQRYEYPDGRIARHENDVLCRQVDGAPDYTDPDFCPVLYSRDRG